MRGRDYAENLSHLSVCCVLNLAVVGFDADMKLRLMVKVLVDTSTSHTDTASTKRSQLHNVLGLWKHKFTGATKHRIGYIGCIGHIGVQIMLLQDMTQYKVIKGKRLGSVLVKQFSQAQLGWGLGRDRAPPQNIIRLR